MALVYPLPMAVSLVGVAAETQHHKQNCTALLPSDEWTLVDVREFLTRDPAGGGVSHTENGRSEATQQVAALP